MRLATRYWSSICIVDNTLILKIFIVLLVPIATAQANPAVERGEAVVEQWCRMCHLRKDDKPDPDLAPPFEQIVLWPDRDRDYLQRFLREDHFPMTMFRLFDHEKADVIEYLIHLQDEASMRSP